MTAAFAIW